jgi:predicted nucleotidyltransferase
VITLPHLIPHPRRQSAFLPRDYISTREGAIFAVVGFDGESSRVLGQLRYSTRASGASLHKVSTQEAALFLNEHPQYAWHCPRRDCLLPGIPLSEVDRHFRPEDAARQAVERPVTATPIRREAARLIASLVEFGIPLERIGLTGSLTLDLEKEGSDIDLVIYGRAAFQTARAMIHEGFGNGTIGSLSETQWHDTWLRRGCPLSLNEYVWHEERKLNKGISNGIRFDVTLLQEDLAEPEPGRKVGNQELIATVLDASTAYDWPATYRIDHPNIATLVTYTGTYFGQIVDGENAQARGVVEELASGGRRMVIGLDREAEGHYLRVAPGQESSQQEV